MRRAFGVVVWSAMLAVPSIGYAQVNNGAVIGVGYGILAVAAIGRVIRGNGEADARAGSRVRVGLASGAVEGSVVSASTDSLVVESPTGTQTFRAPDLRDVRVSVGEQSRWAQGFFWGFGVGAVGGAAAGLVSGDDQSGFIRFTADEKALIGGVFFGMAGSLVGTVIGAASSGEGWARARQPLGGGSVAITPVLGRETGVAVRLRF
jgi:hypothetical protein